jgi:hypothetical protein
MIHNFFRIEIAPDRDLHHQPVLRYIAVTTGTRMQGNPDPDIAVLFERSALLPFRMTRTKSRTCAGCLETQAIRSTLNGRPVYAKSFGDLLLSVTGGKHLTQPGLVNLLRRVLWKVNSAPLAEARNTLFAHMELVCNANG